MVDISEYRVWRTRDYGGHDIWGRLGLGVGRMGGMHVYTYRCHSSNSEVELISQLFATGPRALSQMITVNLPSDHHPIVYVNAYAR